MATIKKHETEKIVTEVAFETSDGEMHKSASEAQLHQDILDGKKKKCHACNGGKYEYYQKEHFQPGIENGGYPTSVTTEKRLCGKCSGRGFLELKFA